MGKLIDLIGKKSGRLTVVSRAENRKSGQPQWKCICDCGNYCIVVGHNLRSNVTKSCGCISSPHILTRIERHIDKSSGRWI